MSLMMPALQGARESTRRLQCSNNLYQIIRGIQQYEQLEQTYPPGRVGCDGITDGVCAGVPDIQRVGTSGFVLILPYMDSGGLYRSFDLTEGLWGPSTTWKAKNLQAIATRPNFYICPSDSAKPFHERQTQAAVGSYAFCMGTNGTSHGLGLHNPNDVKINNTGLFYYVIRHDPAHVQDGLMNTIFVGETIDGNIMGTSNIWTLGSRHMDSLRNTDNPPNCKPPQGVLLDTTDPSAWDPKIYNYITAGSFASHHKAGVNFVFGDGHVGYIHDDIDTTVYRALSTRAGHEVVGADKL